MKIIRYQSPEGTIGLAERHADGTATKLRGTFFEKLEPTSEPAVIAKLLAPLEPRALLCIGLNCPSFPNSVWERTFGRNSVSRRSAPRDTAQGRDRPCQPFSSF